MQHTKCATIHWQVLIKTTNDLAGGVRLEILLGRITQFAVKVFDLGCPQLPKCGSHVSLTALPLTLKEKKEHSCQICGIELGVYI